jgi:hypothetical protein
MPLDLEFEQMLYGLKQRIGTLEDDNLFPSRWSAVDSCT